MNTLRQTRVKQACFASLLLVFSALSACDCGSNEDNDNAIEVSTPTGPESEEARVEPRIAVGLPVEWLDPSSLSENELEATLAAPPPSQEVIEARLWYAMHPETRREGHQRMEIRREQQAVEDAEREALMDQLPVLGSLTVRSRPMFALFRIDNGEPYIPHPSRNTELVETRSGTIIDDLSVDEPHVITVTLPNYQEQQLELLPFGEEGSLWERDDRGYYARLLAELEPEPDVADELFLRMNAGPDVPELHGQITVRSEPSGASVTYNGQLLVDDEGLPLTTPATFDTYQSPTGPFQIILRHHGAPIRAELDGYLSVETGVYTHMYQCEPISDSPTEAQWWEACRYTYDTGLIQLTTVAE